MAKKKKRGEVAKMFVKFVGGTLSQGGELKERADALLEIAEAAAERAEHWTDLHNAVFGLGSKFSMWFPDRSDRVKFTQSYQCAKIMDMIEDLRERKGDPESVAAVAAKANGAISLRLPQTIHAALLAEADAEGVSLNQLCLAKLVVQLNATAT